MSKLRKRQYLVGRVVATKMKNTVSVLVTRVISHPIYKKSGAYSKTCSWWSWPWRSQGPSRRKDCSWAQFAPWGLAARNPPGNIRSILQKDARVCRVCTWTCSLSSYGTSHYVQECRWFLIPWLLSHWWTRIAWRWIWLPWLRLPLM